MKRILLIATGGTIASAEDGRGLSPALTGAELARAVAEIAALAVPSVLVPYPLATADHQTTNARFLVDAGAAVMFADADIDGAAFADELAALLADPGRRASMRAAAQGLGQDRAAALLADELSALV